MQTCLKCGAQTPIEADDPSAACVHCGAIQTRVARAQASRSRQQYQTASRSELVQRRRRGLWTALAVAPIAMAPIGFVVLVLINVGAVVQGFFLSCIAFPIVGYLYELALAIPLFALLSRPEPPSAGAFAALGCLVGCIPAICLAVSHDRDLGPLAIGALSFGAVLGLILWALQRERGS